MSDTPRTDRWEYEQQCNFDVPWEDHCRTLERELVAMTESHAICLRWMAGEQFRSDYKTAKEMRAANDQLRAKLSKLSRMIDIAGQANDAASEAEVANSATFAEALAITHAEIVEDELRAEVERLKEQKSLIVKICQSTKHLNQIKDILRAANEN